MLLIAALLLVILTLDRYPISIAYQISTVNTFAHDGTFSYINQCQRVVKSTTITDCLKEVSSLYLTGSFLIGHVKVRHSSLLWWRIWTAMKGNHSTYNVNKLLSKRSIFISHFWQLVRVSILYVHAKCSNPTMEILNISGTHVI